MYLGDAFAVYCSSPPGWTPVVDCINPGTGPAKGMHEGSPLDRLPSPAKLSGCYRMFNGSAAADHTYLSDWQQFELRPVGKLEELEPRKHGVAEQMQSGPNTCSSFGSGCDIESAQTRYVAHSGTTHVVLFEHMLPKVAEWLHEGGYIHAASFMHADFAVDREHEAFVLVYKRTVADD